jgi:DNA polymerase-3 subunit delta
VKVSLAQLGKQLAGGLSSVYFVAGDEPLQIGEALDAIRLAARKQGYEDREVFVVGAGFNWDSIRNSAGNMSLFATRRIVEVRLPTGKPGRVGGPMLAELAEDPPPDTLLIIIAEQFDSAVAKAKWVEKVSAAGVAVITRPVSLADLPAWIENNLRQQGLSFDPAVVELLVHRVEGNLLAARQEIDKLALLATDAHVSVDLAQQSVADGARFDVFQLSDVALRGDQTRAIRMLYGLRSEGVAAPLVLWALVRESLSVTSVWLKMEQGVPAGTAMKQSGIWSSKQQLMSSCLRRHNRESIDYLLMAAVKADRIVKGASYGSPWDALLELLQAIGQPGAGVRGQLSA